MRQTQRPVGFPPSCVARIGMSRKRTVSSAWGRVPSLILAHALASVGIVVTSLSDTESDDSPDPATPPIDLSAATDEIIEIPSSDQLTQPGSRGFTIHPTLLNRLNRMTEAERSRLPFGPGRYPRTEERGLILYRTPGETLNGVTRTGEMDSDDDDGDRFQVLPDEEAMSTDGMEVEPEPDGGMAAMSDVEVDQSGIMEDVDSMEIG